MPEIRFKLGAYEARVDDRLRRWRAEKFASRLWAKDYTLWSQVPVPEITDRLGWLELPRKSLDEVCSWKAFREEAAGEFDHAVLLGMGGSSLAPEVFATTFGSRPGGPKLMVLDTTHPGAIAAAESALDLARTLFLVSSKSGTTIETASLFRYFYARVAAVTNRPGRHFVAITDPGSALATLGADRQFRRVFTAPPDVGGRYSALSAFGLLPASLVGADVEEILRRGRAMAETCGPADAEPGLKLGAALGEMALAGRDKVTLVASPSLASFPLWLEQLIAESAGKDGKGIVPVAEPWPTAAACGPSGAYGRDRVFVYIHLKGERLPGDAEERTASEGHPQITIVLDDALDLGAEMFRWEIAVAAACAAIGVHPFNQPDVEIAKQLARKVMAADPSASPDAAAGQGVSAGPAPASGGTAREAAASLAPLVAGSPPGHYVCLQAYVAPNPAATDLLEAICLDIRARSALAATFGYGPRFLHSTGQLHKGGPNTGIFVQLADRAAIDKPVPETAYSFGDLIRAQAIGDRQALHERGRTVLPVDLGRDALVGLQAFREALGSAR
jgi:transaldolase/glucose-6-phosphate isomerase